MKLMLHTVGGKTLHYNAHHPEPTRSQLGIHGNRWESVGSRGNTRDRAGYHGVHGKSRDMPWDIPVGFRGILREFAGSPWELPWGLTNIMMPMSDKR